jgi:hypothetical protein
MFALAFYTVDFKLYVSTILRRLHPQEGGENLRLLGAALVADSNTGVAAENQNFPVAADRSPYFFKRFLFSYYHCLRIPLCLFYKIVITLINSLSLSHCQPDRRGPHLFYRSVNSVQISAHRGPMAADRLNISNRSGSMLTWASSFRRCSILFFALVFPSRK